MGKFSQPPRSTAPPVLSLVADPFFFHGPTKSPELGHDIIKLSSLDWFCEENLNRKPMGFYHQIDRVFRFNFSQHPILIMENDDHMMMIR